MRAKGNLPPEVREICRLVPEERMARLKRAWKLKSEKLADVAAQMRAQTPARERAQRECRRREREERGN